METPSIQRMTRSKARQTGTGEKLPLKTAKEAETAAVAKDRAPLFDVTNSDSPIAGIVPGKPFPSRLRSATKWNSGKKGAAQDGEELLRSQVRALLGQKSPGISLPSFHIPTDDLQLVHSPCSATKKAPTPANTPVTSSAASSKGFEALSGAIERLETGGTKDSEDEGSPPQGITRALRFEVADSPTALTIRTPIVADRRLKSVVVVPSPDEGEKSANSEDLLMSASRDVFKSDGQEPSNLSRMFQTLQQHEPQWSSEVQVSSAERYWPNEDADAEPKDGPFKVDKSASSQVSSAPLQKQPLALGVFSPVPAPRIAWKRHVAASRKPPIFEDLPVGVLEGAGPKGLKVSTKSAKSLEEAKPTQPKKSGGALPLLRRALINDSANKQKKTPAKPTKHAPPGQFPIPAWYGSPTKQTEAKPEAAIDEICNNMKSLNVSDGRAFLRGLPLHEGSHLRFDSNGEEESMTKGLPKPKASHTRFE